MPEIGFDMEGLREEAAVDLAGTGPLTALVVDADGVVRQALGDLAEILGTAPADVIGKSFDEALAGMAPLASGVRAAQAGRRGGDVVLLGDRTVRARFLPTGRDRQGCGALLIVDDVTDAVSAEARLRASEARLRDVQRVAHIGSWEWDVLEDELRWSDELRRIYGVPDATRTTTLDELLERVHEDDVERTRAALFEALRSSRAFEIEHRIRRPDATVRMVHCQGESSADASGRVARLLGSCWDVTERWRGMVELEEAVALLRATLDATADGILVVDREGHLLSCNTRFRELWRLDAGLVQRGDDERMLAEAASQLEDPIDFRARVNDLYATPEAESFDVLRFKDGRVYERLSRPHRIGGRVAGRVWSFRDVTKRERLCERLLFLSEASRILASLNLDQGLRAVSSLAVRSFAGTCTIELHGEAGRGAPAAPNGRGAPPARIEGAACAPSLRLEDAPSRVDCPIFASAARVGTIHVVARDGRTFADADLRAVEELAVRIGLAVENARLFEEAKAALAAREELLSMAAHEIRSPITSLQLATQYLRRNGLPEPRRARLLDAVERDARRLSRLVDDLVEVRRIDVNRLAEVLEELDLVEVVHDVVERLLPEAARVGSTVTVDAPAPIRGAWDRARLDRVVQNLLTNAVKFGLGKPILVDVGASDGVARLIVKDRGIGIARADQERIFLPFERAVPPRRYGGLGLGLHIVRSIVDEMGGTIRVDSRPDEGTTFTVELPRSRP